MLCLEDLQWSDHATLALVAAFGPPARASPAPGPRHVQARPFVGSAARTLAKSSTRSPFTVLPRVLPLASLTSRRICRSIYATASAMIRRLASSGGSGAQTHGRQSTIRELP